MVLKSLLEFFCEVESDCELVKLTDNISSSSSMDSSPSLKEIEDTYRLLIRPIYLARPVNVTEECINLCTIFAPNRLDEFYNLISVNAEPMHAPQPPLNISNSSSSKDNTFKTIYLGRTLESRYLLNGIIGKGGMGAVYRAFDQRLEKEVAIKVVNDHFAQEQEMKYRFLREARISAQIDHPNAISVYDFGLLPEGNGFIVMEYFKAISLRDLLNKQFLIAQKDIIEIARQTCSAIAVAHQAGIVHLDLKPENILIKYLEQGKLQIKVVDFGLAKFIDYMNQSSSNITAKDTIMGTPIYMSPEQCSSGNTDEQSDVYALGIIMYELFTGYPPFEGSYAAVLRQQLFELAPPINSEKILIHPILEELIMQMLKKKKSERPSLARVLFLLDMLTHKLNPTDEPIKRTELATLKKIPTLKINS